MKNQNVIEVCKLENINLIIDADALWHITNDNTVLEILKSNKIGMNSNIILTPNKIEYIRLANNFDINHLQYESILKIAKHTNQNVCLKGENDIFSDGETSFVKFKFDYCQYII